MSRLRSNFKSGTTSADITNVATTVTSSSFAGLPVVASPNVLMVVLDPTGVAGNPEIIKVTAHSSASTTITVVRAQEGTTARAHLAGTIWRHTPTAFDFEREGTWTEMNAATPEVGMRWHATDQGIPYRGDGTSWKRQAGNPFDIWITDYGAVPTNGSGTGLAAANVIAIRAAIAAAVAGFNAPRKPSNVVCPATIAGSRYFVNETIAVDLVRLVGTPGGSGFNQFGEADRVRIDGTGISPIGPTLNVGTAGAGASTFTQIENLDVYGNLSAIKVKETSLVSIRDCELSFTESSHADRSALHVENSFWVRCERVGMYALSGYAATQRTLLIVASDYVNVMGLCQATFRDIIMANGQVRFENRRTTGVQGGDSANVEFTNVVSESCQTQPFLTHTSVGTIQHDLMAWSFDHCERADADVTGVSFISLATSGGTGMNMKWPRIQSSQMYTQYVFHTAGCGVVAPYVDCHAIGNPIFSPTSNSNRRGIVKHSEDSLGVTSTVDQGYGNLFVDQPGDALPRWLVSMTGYTEGSEIADPAAPAANRARTYFRDNGAGKTQFVVRFPTGAIQVLATEP